MTEWDGLVTFTSSFAAIRAERRLNEADIPNRLIPGPRDISPRCGVALQFEYLQRDDVERVLRSGNVPVDGLHRYCIKPETDALLAQEQARGPSRFRRQRRRGGDRD